MKITKAHFYFIVVIWIILSVCALSQDSWLIAAMIGLVSSVLGMLVAKADAEATKLKTSAVRTCGIWIVLGGIMLIVYALLDRFVIGWPPRS
jgi:hypothetical protein